MAVLIIFPVILQTVISLIMLSIGGQEAENGTSAHVEICAFKRFVLEVP